MINVILFLIIIISIFFIYTFVKDLIKHREELKKNPKQSVILMFLSPIIFFLSTFGISDFAIATLIYRKFKFVKDTILPGTLNTQCAIPMTVMALAFVTTVKIDILTLTVCLIMQVIGAYLGPQFVVKLPEHAIRKCISVGLVLASILILSSKLHMLPSGGTATTLTGYKLVIAACCFFVFGALNNIAIGSFALTIVTVYALGLHPIAAFPIMMGACALSIPIASVQFIKFGAYDRKATLAGSTFGLIGVFSAVYFIQNLDLSAMQWVIAFVLLYSGFNMGIRELKFKKTPKTSEASV